RADLVDVPGVQVGGFGGGRVDRGHVETHGGGCHAGDENTSIGAADTGKQQVVLPFPLNSLRKRPDTRVPYSKSQAERTPAWRAGASPAPTCSRGSGNAPWRRPGRRRCGWPEVTRRRRCS